jgi:hypothetical protein
MAEVILTDEAVEWFDSLDEAEQDSIDKAIGRLQLLGVRLGFPHSSEIKSSQYAMRELRVGGSPLRALYIFDAARDAVVLCGGDKSGNEKRWYAENVSRAERIWEQYLKEQSR